MKQYYKPSKVGAIALVVCIVYLGACIYFLGIITSNDVIDYVSAKISFLQASNQSTECFNMTIEDTAYCLRNELKTFYNYNLSNVGKIMTEDELRLEGGVCSQYSEWFVNKASDLGFYAKKVAFDTTNNTSHVIAIISGQNKDDTKEYCVLDQTFVNCQELA